MPVDAVGSGRAVPSRPRVLGRSFYGRAADQVAGDLIGKILSYGPLRGRIVEVEAYAQTEPASRGYHGPTKGNATLFGPPGHLDVYLVYGIHYLANIVCRPAGVGSGVLLRALEPLSGLDVMRTNRGDPRDPDHRLCSGPGRLSRAFGLGRDDDGADLVDGAIRILDDSVLLPLARSIRIGVTAGRDLEWRFYAKAARACPGRAPPADACRRSGRHRSDDRNRCEVEGCRRRNWA